jgi:septum formation protein
VTLILASASRIRADLLSAAGIAFEVHPAEVDESALRRSLAGEGRDAVAIAERLALEKALWVSHRRPDALVLGGDQILEFQGRVIGKCTGLAEALRLLRAMRGQTHRLCCAAALVRNGAPCWQLVDNIVLKMRDFSDGFLDAYLAAEGEGILAAVGCYQLEGRGSQLFERIEGDYFSVLGLPLLPLLAALRDQGVVGT